MGGRLPQGERPETRNGRPFKPYVYRGAGPYVEPIIRPGQCECGCGGETPISTRTDKRYGAIKGKPRRFILGHNVSIPPRNVA